MARLRITTLAGLLCLLVVAGCAPGNTPAQAVESYLKALEAKDEIAAVNASCLAWEEGAVAEASSFEAVGVTLEGLSCSQLEAADGEGVVACQGEFVADYGGEIQNIDLSRRTFQVVDEGGLWKMCGYR